MKNSNIKVSFESRILSVKFMDYAVIEGEDLKEIYSFANEKANGMPYGVVFEAVNHYEVTDSAIKFILNNPNNVNVLAKAYVINTEEAYQKTKHHLFFDNPALKPFTFKTTEKAIKWLKAVVTHVPV